MKKNIQIKNFKINRILFVALSSLCITYQLYGSPTDRIYTQYSDIETELHHVAAHNMEDRLCEYLKQGATVNAKNRKGDTPLHIAVRNGKINNVRILLEHHAQADEINNDRKTPLHIAAEVGSVEIAQLLKQYGANFNAKDKNDQTPLIRATVHVRSNIVRFILEYPATPEMRSKIVNAKDQNGNTALHVATDEEFHEIALLLLELGADVNVTNNDNKTPLEIAARINAQRLIKAFLEKGADIFITSNFWQQTALHYAVTNRDIKTLQMILEHLHKHLSSEIAKRYINQPDSTGQTALHHSLELNLPIYEKLLIDHGAQIDVPDHNGQTLLHKATLQNDTKLVLLLLQKNANVNAQDASGKTPLHIAAENEHHNLEELLIDHGAQINMPDHNDNTPLQIVTNHHGPLHAHWDQAFATQNDAYLLYLAHYLDFKDKSIETPQINAPNQNGLTVLHIAALKKNKPLSKLLIHRGALNLPDNEFHRPTDLTAIEMKNFIITLFHQNQPQPQTLFELMQEKLYEIQQHDSKILDAIGDSPHGGLKDKVNNYYQNHGLLKLQAHTPTPK